MLERSIPPGSVDPEAINGIYEILQQQGRDISILNTGLGRVERKQNRWVDILNHRREDENGGREPALFAGDKSPAQPQPGEETEPLSFGRVDDGQVTS